MIKYDVRFFRPEEFRCPCCGSLGNPLSGQGGPARLLVLWLDLFRAAWGAPVIVNSGFRCSKHNIEVGGAEKSRHLLGCAADIAPNLMQQTRSVAMEDFKRLGIRMFSLPGWEVKTYSWGLHVAVPRDEESRMWNGSAIIL